MESPKKPPVYCQSMSLSRTSLASFVFYGFELVAATLATIIVNHTLGVDERGQFALLYTTAVMVFSISHLSLTPVSVREIGSKEKPLGVYAGTLFALSFLCLCLYGTFLVAGRGLGLFDRFTSHDRFLVLLALAIGPVLLLLEHVGAILQGTMNIRWLNITKVFPRMANLSLIVVAGLLGLVSVKTLLSINLIGVIATAFLAVVFVLRISSPSTWRVSAGTGRRLLAQAILLHVGVVAWFFCMRNHVYFLRVYRTDVEVGLFAVALTAAESLLVGLKAVVVVLFPVSSGQSFPEAKQLVSGATRRFVLVSSFLAAILILSSPVFMFLYAGKRYFPSILPMIVLLPGQVLSLSCAVTYVLFYFKRWYGSATLLMVLTCGSALVWSRCLIPNFGVLGAAFASTMTFALQFVLTWFALKKWMDCDPKEFFLPKIEDAHQVKSGVWDFLREASRRLKGSTTPETDQRGDSGNGGDHA